MTLIEQYAIPSPKLPVVMTREVRLHQCKYDTWITAPVTDEQRPQIETALAELAKRLTPANPTTTAALIAEMFEHYDKVEKFDPEYYTPSLTEFSAIHLAGSLKLLMRQETVVLPKPLRDECFARYMKAVVMRYRARVLLGHTKPFWYEIFENIKDRIIQQKYEAVG